MGMNSLMRLFVAIMFSALFLVFSCSKDDKNDGLSGDDVVPGVNDDDDDDDDDVNGGPCTIEVTAAIDIDGGLLTLSDGASLFISPGSLENETVIGFGTTTAVEVAEGMEAYTPIYCAEPFGKPLNAPSVLTMSIGAPANVLAMPLPRIYTATSFVQNQPATDGYYGLAVTLYQDQSTASVHIDQLSWYFEGSADPAIGDTLVSPFGGWIPGTVENSQMFIADTVTVDPGRGFYIARLSEADDESANYATPPAQRVGSVFKIYLSSMQLTYTIQLSLPTIETADATIYQYNEDSGVWVDLSVGRPYDEPMYSDINITVAVTDGAGYFVVVDRTPAN
jgi:hypothetical protein